MFSRGVFKFLRESKLRKDKHMEDDKGRSEFLSKRRSSSVSANLFFFSVKAKKNSILLVKRERESERQGKSCLTCAQEL